MGATYIKNHHGPTSVELKDVVADMQTKAKSRQLKVHILSMNKIFTTYTPQLEKFSAREIEHIDEVLARLADKNAKEIETTHTEIFHGK